MFIVCPTQKKMYSIDFSSFPNSKKLEIQGFESTKEEGKNKKKEKVFQ